MMNKKLVERFPLTQSKGLKKELWGLSPSHASLLFFLDHFMKSVSLFADYPFILVFLQVVFSELLLLCRKVLRELQP